MLIRQGLFGVAAFWLVTAASAETYQPETLMKEYEVNETSCKSNPNNVWAVVDNKGDCIRYYAAGFSNGPNKSAIIYIHGDRLWGEKPIGYDDNDSDKQQQNVEEIHKALGLPFVMIARPGTYGSSGSHAHRREMREVELVDAAIKVIRDRYKIEQTALTGQSGGGTVAAYVLTKQPDLNCVVLTSSALSRQPF